MLTRRPSIAILALALLMLALVPLLASAQQPSVPPESGPPPNFSPAPPDKSPTPPDMSKLPWSPVRRKAAPGESAPPIQVSVKLVTVLTGVTDSNGAPYAGLKKEDFRLFEDGVAQKIAVFERQSELPLSVVLAMDTSLSTRKDLPLEVAAARKFAHALLTPRDTLSLFDFSTYVSQALPFTGDLRSIDSALGHLRTGPATALYDAIELGAEALARRQGRKVIVLITDGGDTASRAEYPDALRAAQTSDALIYSVVMVPIEADAGRDLGGEHALIQLSEDTGGRYYYASSLAQLDEAFGRIGDELRTQYLLGYYPAEGYPAEHYPAEHYPAEQAGREFRRIRVELAPEAVQGAGHPLAVHHRAGYYAGKTE